MSMSILTLASPPPERQGMSRHLLVIFGALGVVGGVAVMLWPTIGPGSAKASANQAFAQGEQLSRAGQGVSALACYTEAIRLQPKDARAYYGRGLLQEDFNRVPEAIADLTAAIALNPKLTAAYYHRGALYHLAGRNEDAQADFARAIELNPRDSEAYLRRAAFSARLAQYAQADADYTQALALQPTNLNIYALRSVVRTMSGDYRGAAEDRKVLNGHAGEPEPEQSSPELPGDPSGGMI